MRNTPTLDREGYLDCTSPEQLANPAYWGTLIGQLQVNVNLSGEDDAAQFQAMLDEATAERNRINFERALIEWRELTTYGAYALIDQMEDNRD